MANRLELRNSVRHYLRLYGTRGLQFAPCAARVQQLRYYMLLGAVIEAWWAA
jgi:hypothetical protein